VQGNDKQDSAFFASPNTQSQQLKVGYQFGRLSVHVSATNTTQKQINITGTDRVPIRRLPLQPPNNQIVRDSVFVDGGGQTQTTSIAFLPQLCFPIGPLKMQLYAGPSLNLNNPPNLKLRTTQLPGTVDNNYYDVEGEKNSNVGLQAGASFQIMFSKRIGIEIQGDFNKFSLKYAVRDRLLNNNVVQKKLDKTVLQARAGLVFKL
jgi:hypothetical protein